MRARLRGPGAFATSFVLHGVVLAVGGWLLARSLQTTPAEVAAPVLVDVSQSGGGIELPAVAGIGVDGAPEPPTTAVIPPAEPGGGGDRVPRPDMVRPGRGGTVDASEPAANLADSNDGLTLDRDPLNRFDRSQVQRLRTATNRQSWDDRRATPNAMEMSFLASGTDGHHERRRPPARHDPSRGLLTHEQPTIAGGRLGPEEFGSGSPEDPRAGGAVMGSDRDRSGPGLATSRPGIDHRASASVALARPWVPAARPAVPAVERDRPNDTIDSAQEVAQRVASLIHASTAGGHVGAGPGGTAGGATPGSSGLTGLGSRSRSNGYGPGPRRDDMPDPRLVGYARNLLSRVRWDRAFPEWAISQGRGGIAIIGVTVLPDGRVAKIRIVRPSGVVEFDRNLIAAIERAAPFDPIPHSLNTTELPVHLRFDALNPAVGREGPGPGRRH
jgi:TonB family protein